MIYGVWSWIGIGILCFGALFILREVVCWYFRLTKIVAVLEDIKGLLVEAEIKAEAALDKID